LPNAAVLGQRKCASGELTSAAPRSYTLQSLAEHGIRLDCLDTANAVATFNILSQEGRRVAAALLPASQEPVVAAPAPEAPRSTTGPFPNWRDRERMV
jgi:hypothetical protein